MNPHALSRSRARAAWCALALLFFAPAPGAADTGDAGEVCFRNNTCMGDLVCAQGVCITPAAARKRGVAKPARASATPRAVKQPPATRASRVVRASGGHSAPRGFVYVPPGSFTMGSPASEEKRTAFERERDRSGKSNGPFSSTPAERTRLRNAAEAQRQIRLTRGFWMEKHEVTQKQWRAIMGRASQKRWACGKHCPATGMNLFDVATYLNRRSRRDGLRACYRMTGCSGTPSAGTWTRPSLRCKRITWDKTCDGYRLPTNAEWEYAARAGTTGPYYGPLDRIAWYRGGANLKARSPSRVMKKAPNAFGLYDMLGNVDELVWGSKGLRHGRRPHLMAAVDPVEGGLSLDFSGEGYTHPRMLTRGGAWVSPPERVRAACHSGTRADLASYVTGFRVVRSVPTRGAVVR